MNDLGHWDFDSDFNIEEWFGFIYRIIEKSTGKEYIGKKQFFSKNRKIVKGKKNRRIITKESDWKTYRSSSDELKERIEQHGEDNYIFLIESLHPTKGGLSYAEIEAQVSEDVLRAKLENGEKKFFNKCISNIKFTPPDKVSSKTRAKISGDNHYFNKMTEEEKLIWLSETGQNLWQNNLNEKEREEFIETHFKGENNPMFGKTGEQSPRFGKDPWANLSEEHKQQLRDDQSSRSAGENNPRFGKSPFEYFTEEELIEHKKNLKGITAGEKNGMFGKPCYINMTDEEKQQWKDNISNATKGKEKSDATKERMRKPKSPQRQITCQHCNKTGGINNMVRHHFDKCKHKKILE